MEKEIRSLEAELASLESSLSWRLTAPLRALEGTARGLIRRVLLRKQPPADAFSWIDELEIRKGGRGILADCSMTIRGQSSPGMRRVTRGVLRGSQAGDGGLVPVDILSDSLRRTESFFGGLDAETKAGPWEAEALLLLDASWDYVEGARRLARKFRAAGVPVYALVHDTVPLDRPDFCLPQVVEKFSRWLGMVFSLCDGVICVSETTARQVQKHRVAMAPDRGDLQIVPWLPGSENLNELETSGELVPPDDYFLCVGTVEPRKNYGELLDGISELWATGKLQTRLVIFGERGWGVDPLVERLIHHPEWGRRLWWFEGGSDRHLRALYENCQAFVLPSLDEGFSQPLSEAAGFDKPVVLSDIPIFRERVSAGGIFFQLGDANSLICALETAATPLIPPTKVHSADWASSARFLCELVTNPTAQRECL